MSSVVTFAYMFFISLALLVFGRYFKDYTVGILGGFMLFLLGLYVIIEPLVGLASWFNLVVGTVLFGLGGYIWVRGGIEWINVSG